MLFLVDAFTIIMIIFMLMQLVEIPRLLNENVLIVTDGSLLLFRINLVKCLMVHLLEVMTM